MEFRIEQIALCPKDPARAIQLLNEMGAGEWAFDHVLAEGTVRGAPGRNEADLAFNYDMLGAARELEVLRYTNGPNWMDDNGPSVSHLGMHCSPAELALWRKFFRDRGIGVAQEVMTQRHTNPVIDGERWYNYVIFDTREILGVDVKFIVRRDAPGKP